MIEVSMEKNESEIQSDDIVYVVEKRRSKVLQKQKTTQKPMERKAPIQKEIDPKKKGKDEPVKRRVKETAKRKKEESPDELFNEPGFESKKGLGSKSKKVKVEKELERIKFLKTQKVLNERVFGPKIISKPGMCDFADDVELQSWTHLFVNHVLVLHEAQMRELYYNVAFVEDGSLNTQVGNRRLHLDEEMLGEILKVPREGIRSIAGQSCSKGFVHECRKLPKLSSACISKKFLKWEYQFYFEFINKVLFPNLRKELLPRC